MRTDQRDYEHHGTENQGQFRLQENQNLDLEHGAAGEQPDVHARKAGSVPPGSHDPLSSRRASTAQAEMTALRESPSPSSTTTGTSPSTSSQSTEYSSIITSQPTDSDIPFQEATIIEENQLTYLLSLLGARVPTEVPKESVPEEIRKKWEALKAAMLPPAKTMRHGKSAGVKVDHHAPIDLDAEVPSEAGDNLIRQPQKRQRVTVTNHQSSGNLDTQMVTPPFGDSVIANESPKASSDIIPDEDLEALQQDWQGNAGHDAPSSGNVGVTCAYGDIDSKAMEIPSGSLAPSQSGKHNSSINGSEQQDSSINNMPSRKGKIIEEGQSAYWVTWADTELPNPVPKENVAPDLKRDWEAMKATLPTPAGNTGHSEPGTVKTKERAKGGDVRERSQAKPRRP